jgi:hypothetical protein
MKIIVFVIYISSILSLNAIGCEPYQSSLFQPDEENFEPYEDKASGGYVELPKLKIEKIQVDRGVGNDGFTCIDAGTLTITLSKPKSSPYKFSDFGVYIKVVKNRGEENILSTAQYPLLPVSKKANIGKYSVAWLDGAPKEHKDIYLEVEIFVISHNLEIGPSTYGKIISKAKH